MAPVVEADTGDKSDRLDAQEQIASSGLDVDSSVGPQDGTSTAAKGLPLLRVRKGTFMDSRAHVDVEEDPAHSWHNDSVSSDQGSEQSSLLSARKPSKTMAKRLSPKAFASNDTRRSEGDSSTTAWSLDVAPKLESAGGRSSSAVVAPAARFAPAARDAAFDIKKEHWKEWGEVLKTIEDIKKQFVEEALKANAYILVTQVRTEVSVMLTLMRGHSMHDLDHLKESAMERLRVLPDIMLYSSGLVAAKAKEKVQKGVEHLIQGVKDVELGEGRAFAKRKTALLAEVQQIATDAVEEAWRESKVHAQQHVHQALQSLPADAAGLRKLRLKCDVKMPGIWLGESVTQANDGNQAVASMLLRAKSLGERDSLVNNQTPSTAVSEAPSFKSNSVPNPGSIGHPESCPRPCIFYASGNCTNGSSCEFCHLPHNKRPARLDKRHREMLKEIPFQALVSLVIPILRDKVQGLHLGPAASCSVALLGAKAERCPPARQGSRSQKAARKSHILVEALKAMTLRSLLTMLRRAAPANSPLDAEVDALLQQLRASNVSEADGLSTRRSQTFDETTSIRSTSMSEACSLIREGTGPSATLATDPPSDEDGYRTDDGFD